MRPSIRLALGLALIGLAWSSTIPAEAGGGLFRKRSRPVVETATTTRPQDQVAPSPMLGSFRSVPYITVGRGYAPLEFFGREQSLAVYGPLSAFRSTSAPVTTVVRGYDGVPTLVEGTSFSNPNLPALSPVVYPTRASNYSALRTQTSPRLRDNALMWIDQNCNTVRDRLH